MTTDRLRDELARLGEQAPSVHLDPDTWARGRRARRRDRVAALVAVLVLVAGLGGLTAVLTEGPGAPSPAGDVGPSEGAGAVPSAIHVPPERLVRFPESATREVVWHEDVAETDLAIGRASVAFQTGDFGSLPVLITAVDGRYHPLVLPGWAGAGSVNGSLGATALALSPDGRSLAYAWWDPEAPLDAPMPAGVRVLDLETGDLRTIALEGGNGVAVQTIAWSPDSRWLAWQGNATKSWTPGSYGFGKPVSGRVPPGSSTSEAGPDLPAGSAIAVSSAGAVTAIRPNGRMALWDVDVVVEGAVDGQLRVTSTGATSPDGTSVALGTFGPRRAASFVDPATGRVTKRPLADGLGLYPDGASVQPLGWLDDSLVAALVRPAPDATLAQPLQLVVMSAPSVPREDWTYRISGGVVTPDDSAGRLEPEQVSVAVDLMTLEQPTRDFPAPEWPWSDERKVGVGIAIGLGVLVALLLLLRWRRRPA